MARLPHFPLALLLLLVCLNDAHAQNTPSPSTLGTEHAEQQNLPTGQSSAEQSSAERASAERASAERASSGRANQGATLSSSSQPGRLPPVRLAEHTEPLDTEASEEDVVEEKEASLSPLSQPLRLGRPQSSSAADGTSTPIDATSSMVTVGTSLAVVLGLFFLLTYLVRRNLPRGVQAAPGEVLEVLGRAPLPGKQQLQVVRFGSKLVLLSVTAEGVEAVSEITEPDEVQQLTALCRRDASGSSAHAFQDILAQMGREPAQGFIDQRSASPPLSRR